MTTNRPLKKTLLLPFVVCSMFFITGCPDDDDPFADPNDPLGLYGTPAFITVQTETDTNIYKMEKSESGKVTGIKDEQGAITNVTYTGDYITGIGQTYSAKVNAEGLYTQTELDYGAFKSQTLWEYNSEGNLTSMLTLHMTKQSNGSFSTDTAARIYNIAFSAQNEGSFMYKTYNIGTLFSTYQGTFKWIERENRYQSFGPYAMMLELTGGFNGFFNIGHRDCISSLNLVELNSGNTTLYDIQYKFDQDDNITERTISTSQSGALGTIRHIFTF